MKHKILPALLVLLFFVVKTTLAAESEPNNDRASANTLVLNGNNTGAISTPGDEDWWKLTTNADGKLDVSLTLPAGSKFLYLYLYDNNGSTVLVSGTSDQNFTVSYDGAASGTYFLKVRAYYASETGSYTISNALTPPQEANDAEPNDVFTQAKNFAQGSTTTGHVGYYFNNKRDTADWFKITTGEDGLLEINTTPGNNNYVYVYLYDNNGTTLLESANSNQSFTVRKDGLAKGTYHVMIRCYYSSQFAPYTISNVLTPPAEGNDSEPNNSKMEATNLGVNKTTTGHVGFYYNQARDTADWYKITTSNDGLIQLTCTPGNGKFIYAYLYDNDGTTLLSSDNSNTTFTVKKDGLAKGTYYVKIKCYYANEFAPYTLSDSLKLYNAAADSGENQTPYQGQTLKANLTTGGHVGFYYNGNRDTEDWWKINYTGDGNLSLTLNPEPNIQSGNRAYTYLKIYKDTTKAPIFDQYTNTSELVANLSNLSKGYLWVKVHCFYSTEFSAYTLTPSFTQKDIAQIGLLNAISGSDCASGQLQFTLSGSQPPYSVQLYRFGSAYGSPIAVANTGSFNVSNLPPGKYTATAFGDGASGNAYSTSNEGQLLPPPPTGLNALQITNSKATLTWNAVSCANGYYLQYRIKGTTKWTTKTILGNKTNLKLTNLTAATTYEWRVATGTGLSTKNYVLSSFANSEFTTVGNLQKSDEQAQLKANPTSVGIKIFPNPAVSQVNIQLSGDESIVTLELKDLTGKTIWQSEKMYPTGLASVSVDVSRFKAGIYFLTVSTPSGILKKEKLVIGR